MTGIICMWHGLIANIPNGWVLCDGTNGTPDLRDKFVVGTPDDIDPGDTGGSVQHRHYTAGATAWDYTEHDHEYDGWTEDISSGSDHYVSVGGVFEKYEEHTHAYQGETVGSGSNHKHGVGIFSLFAVHYPPYYKILFIMKT